MIYEPQVQTELERLKAEHDALRQIAAEFHAALHIHRHDLKMSKLAPSFTKAMRDYAKMKDDAR